MTTPVLGRRALLLGAVGAAASGLVLTETACASAAKPAADLRRVDTSPWPSGLKSLTAAQWKADLAQLDSQVRSTHANPFVIHPEAEWKAGLAALHIALPNLDSTRGKIAIIRQVALLDTHSGVFPEEVGFRQYGLLLKEFVDGVFVVGSSGGKLNGARLIAVGATPIDRVLAALKPLINADNDSAMRDLRPYFAVQVEILEALGFVQAAARPKYVVRMPDGSTHGEDAPIVSFDDLLGPINDTQFTKNTPTSWRAIPQHAVSTAIVDKAVVVRFTAIDQDATAAIPAMTAALQSGRANRVVFDQRYSRGGDYTAADPMREALAALTCPLTVITGTDNVSAASALAEWLRHNTKARFVGAPPPTITNPCLGEVTFTLDHSGVIVHVPQNQWVFDAKEHLSALPMDDPVRDRGASFFRGIDDTLTVALR